MINKASVHRILIAPMPLRRATAVSKLISEVVWDLEYYNERAKKAEAAKYTSSALKTLVQADSKSVLIATRRGALAGFCISKYDDGVIWLAWFGVSKKYRGQ